LFFKGFRRIGTAAISYVLIILCIETLQLVFYVGVFDIDDIMLNALGCVTGFLILSYFKRLAK
jgi:glycopeptide antibiotics resistance protein